MSGSILVLGDICPVAANVDSFASGAVGKVFDEILLGLLVGSLGNVANLETPLTDAANPIVKSGPCLISPAASAAGLAKLNLVGVGLANNHVLDQGEGGLADTMAALDGVGIPYFGGGTDLRAAREPLVVEAGGRTVGFYACAEHEFTIAGSDNYGANPFDPLCALNDVRTLAARVDVCVVLYHGMKEFYRYPSPDVRRSCRALVEAGADFVACQHSHCIGCREVWEGGEILYGQGDFCFCKGDENEMRRNGLVASIDVGNGSVEYLPVANRGGRVHFARGDEGAEILGAFQQRSQQILQPGFVEENWERFCDEMADQYVVQLLMAVKPKWLSLAARAIRKWGVSLSLGAGQDIAHLLNILQCEAHRAREEA